MLQQLIESRARPVRRRGGSAVSVAVHAAAVGLAVAATGRAASRPPEPESPPPVFVVARAAEAPPTARGPAARPGRGARGGAAAPPTAPTLRLPDVAGPPASDLAPADAAPARAVVDVADFVRSGLGTAAGDRAAGDRAAGAGRGGPFDAAAVDEPVVPDPGNRPPRYPEALRAAGLGGRVVARFVVDTSGRVEPGSVEIAASDDPRLAGAVREAVPRLRFRPARAGGVRVRQLVEQPFAFAPGGAAGAGGGGAPR
jgi:protein TonB